jgi:hypothetical protein
MVNLDYVLRPSASGTLVVVMRQPVLDHTSDASPPGYVERRASRRPSVIRHQPPSPLQHSCVPTYRLFDTNADDLGLIEHPASNVEPGDVVVTPDGREALVTSRIEARQGPLTAFREVAIAPTPFTSDDSIA